MLPFRPKANDTKMCVAEYFGLGISSSVMTSVVCPKLKVGHVRLLNSLDKWITPRTRFRLVQLQSPTFLGHSSPRNPIKTGGKALYSSQGQNDSHHTPHLPCHSFDGHAIIPSQASAPKTAAEKKDWKHFSHESNGNPSSQPDKALHFRAHLIKWCSFFGSQSTGKNESFLDSKE